MNEAIIVILIFLGFILIPIVILAEVQILSFVLQVLGFFVPKQIKKWFSKNFD